MMNNQLSPICLLGEQFLAHKRAMGFQYGTKYEFLLRSFLKYSVQLNPEAVVPDKETVSGWFKKSAETNRSLCERISFIRQFSKYLVLMGYEDAYVVPLQYTDRRERRIPYFFISDEIEKFFNSCDCIEKRYQRPGRDLVIPAVFRLLYCCGLRCSEARLLLCCNVCLEQRYIDILQSKGSYSRRIFISSELAEELDRYDKAISRIFPKRTFFFSRNQEKPYSHGFISGNFNRIWFETFPNFNSPIKPVAYDFRNHFAYANLNHWAEQGKDANVMLAYLMRYMGHSWIEDTLYYFHFVPEFFPVFAEKTQALESILPEVSYEE